MTLNPGFTINEGNQYGAGRTRWKTWLALITALGLAVRAAVFVWFGDSFMTRGSSSTTYDAIARHILEGRGFTLDGQNPDLYMFPGYIYTLAGVYATVGSSALAVSTVQTFLIALTGVFVFLAGWRIANVQVGLLAALFVNLLPWLALMAMSLTDGALLAMLTSASFLVACLMLQSSRWHWVIWGGVITGLTILVRSSVQILVPLVAIWLLWTGGVRQWKKATVYIVLVAAMLMPWVMRNWCLCGRFISLSVAPSYLLWGGNNAQISTFINESRTFDMLADPYRPSSGAPQEVLHVAQLMRAEALQFMRAHPWETVRLTARKFFLFYNWSYWPQKIAGPGGGSQDTPHLRLHSLAYAWTTRPLFILALVGAVVGSAKRRELSLLTTFLLLVGLGHAVVATVPRHRVPFEPLLTILAAYAVVWVWDRHARVFVIGAFRSASRSFGLGKYPREDPPVVRQYEGTDA